MITDKEYYLDQLIVNVCDALIDRVTKRKQDALMVVDGKEGSGKTNAAVAMCYYISWKTGRKYDVDHVFFDLEKMLSFAAHTDNQIIHWDEAALGGLSQDWASAMQKKLLQMLMICRKKRHIFVFNIPRFYKLKDYIMDRACSLVNVYENNEEKPGCFRFIGGDYIEFMLNEYKNKKYANYEKYKKFRGTFSYVLPKLIDEDAYEKKKDEAIMKLTEDKKIMSPRQAARQAKITIYRRLREQHPELTMEHYVKLFRVSKNTLTIWKSALTAEDYLGKDE